MEQELQKRLQDKYARLMMLKRRRISDFGQKIGGSAKDRYYRGDSKSDASSFVPDGETGMYEIRFADSYLADGSLTYSFLSRKYPKSQCVPKIDFHKMLEEGREWCDVVMAKMLYDSIPSILNHSIASIETAMVRALALREIMNGYSCSRWWYDESTPELYYDRKEEGISFVENYRDSGRFRDYYTHLLFSPISSFLYLMRTLIHAECIDFKYNADDWSVTIPRNGRRLLQYSTYYDAIFYNDTNYGNDYLKAGDAVRSFIDSLSDKPKEKQQREKKPKPVYIYLLTDGKIVATYRKVRRRISQSDYVVLRTKEQLILEDVKLDDAHDYIYKNRDELETEARILLGDDYKDKYGLVAGKRTGRDWRNGSDANENDFLDTFGFRAVEFGESMPQKERRKHLNNTYDAFMDMAWACGFSPKSIALGGTLGICFGSRGKGGSNAAMAHYEHGKKVINLTRRSGAGCLAHEWFHAFDNQLLKNTDGMGTEKFNDEFRNPATQHNMIDWYLKRTGLKLFKDSETLDKKRRERYWSSGCEVSARCFEYYVIRKLSEMGISESGEPYINEYLAQIPEEKPVYPYPHSEDRDIVFQCYEKMFADLVESDSDVVKNTKLDGIKKQ